jgi:hypothetical protein
MKLIEKTARYEIWAITEDYGVDYYVYGAYVSGDPRVCASLLMARDVAAGL